MGLDSLDLVVGLIVLSSFVFVFMGLVYFFPGRTDKTRAQPSVNVDKKINHQDDASLSIDIEIDTDGKSLEELRRDNQEKKDELTKRSAALRDKIKVTQSKLDDIKYRFFKENQKAFIWYYGSIFMYLLAIYLCVKYYWAPPL